MPNRSSIHPIVKAAAVAVVLASAAAGVWVGSLGWTPGPEPADASSVAGLERLPAADTLEERVGESGAGRGGRLFDERCARCHTVGGGDRKEGPDLAQAALRRDLGWVRAMVARPDSMFRTDSLAQWVLRVHGIGADQVGADDPDLRALADYFSSFDLGR